jgi:sigma-B regulation protein RsbU (phosphoserine phosphatase)
MDERHVGMYILDVSGHGVPAALLAVTLMHRLYSGITRTGAFLTAPDKGEEVKHELLSPAEVARRLNLLYPMDSQNRLYFTFLYGVLDLAAYEFSFVSAGNPGPVLLGADGGAKVHDAPAVPIGLLEDSEYENSVLKLMPGDRLYLHSDGLVEERNKEGEIYGRERLKTAISQTQTMALQASLDFCVNHVISWGGGENLKDDVSMIVVQIEST